MGHDRADRPSREEESAVPAKTAAEAIRRGDERADAGDWLGAVRGWRAAVAASAGDEREVAVAEGRLRAFVRHAGAADPATDRVPRRALGPLAVSLQAALFGVLTMILGNRVEGGRDAVLLWVGWGSFAVSAAATVLFAARSGRLDGTGATLAGTGDPAEVAERAEVIATRLATASPPSVPDTGLPRGRGA